MTRDRAASPAKASTRARRSVDQGPSAPEGVVGWAGQLAAEWAPTAGRVLLGLVLAWFGGHELAQPSLWTGYVPFVSGSTLLVLLVLAHGWLLVMLAVAMFTGIAVRAAAAVALLMLLQIVTSLTMTSGPSDLVLRDVGVLGLAACLTATTRQRLVLTR
ncbi:MAG: hypothetical protein WB797_11200 [Nocardioides sp.]